MVSTPVLPSTSWRDDFDRLVPPHLPMLRAVARRIVGSDDLASDAVQEALLCLWSADSEPVEMRAWLIRTVVHKSLHLVRSTGRRGRHESEAFAGRSESCPLCDPAVLLEQDECDQSIAAALEALSPELRAPFVLRQVHELDYETIARHLNIPVGTVRSRLHRAREFLWNRLSDDSRRRAATANGFVETTELVRARRE